MQTRQINADQGKDPVLNIFLLYDYIYGQGLKGTSLDPKIKTTDPKKLQAIQAKIDNKIDAIKGSFATILNNQALAKEFNLLLKEIGANQLNQFLFDNHVDPNGSLSEAYAFPDEMKIKAKFKELNDTYHIFTETGKDLDPVLNHFVKLFRGCKLLADYVECNNTENNELAYLHAYKLITLFAFPKKAGAKDSNPFLGIADYIRAYDGNNTKNPVELALRHPLPIINPSQPLNDLNGWQKLIAGNKTGILFFQSANKIENKNKGKAPKSISEAGILVSQVTYARYDEFPDLALLCYHYNISEEIFNKCLEINGNRKTKDNLPDVFIDGKDFGYEGYYMVKLPIDDPRAFILGYITNCCQSVGGNSEKCVIDGITLENNGFYVLLKYQGSKKHLNNHPPFLNSSPNKIDYRHYNIIGQAYTWKSKKDNFTLDSWEFLKREEKDYDPIFESMLTKLGEEVSKQSPEMLRMTIGKGGNTPAVLKKQPVAFPEMMLEGQQYIDSASQCLIYIDTVKLKENMKLLSQAWLTKKIFNLQKDDLFKTLDVENISSISEFKELTNFLKDSSGLELSYDIQNPIFYSASICKLYMLNILDQNKLLDQDVLKFITNLPKNSRIINFLTNVLSQLSKEGLLTRESMMLIREIVNKHAEDIKNLLDILTILKEKNLLNADCNKLLLSALIHGPSDMDYDNKAFNKSFSVLGIIQILDRENLLNPDNLAVVLARINILEGYDAGDKLETLKFFKDKLNLLNQDYLVKILDYGHSAYNVCKTMEILKSESFFNDDSGFALFSYPHHPGDLVSAINLLKKEDLLTGTNWTIIIDSQISTRKTVPLLVELKNAGLLEEDVVKALSAHPQCFISIINDVKHLGKNQCAPEVVSKLAQAYSSLQQTNHTSESKKSSNFSFFQNPLENNAKSLTAQIDKQIEKNKQNGEFSPKTGWKDPDSFYPQKCLVLIMLKSYLQNDLSPEAFELVRNSNPMHDKESFFRSETGSLIDRVMEFKKSQKNRPGDHFNTPIKS